MHINHRSTGLNISLFSNTTFYIGSNNCTKKKRSRKNAAMQCLCVNPSHIVSALNYKFKNILKSVQLFKCARVTNLKHQKESDKHSEVLGIIICTLQRLLIDKVKQNRLSNFRPFGYQCPDVDCGNKCVQPTGKCTLNRIILLQP